MNTSDERGSLNSLLIPLILFVLLFLGAAGFGTWAYMGRQDYKTNTDKKVADAVKVAEENTATAKDKEFVEKEKYPLRDYQSPSAFGSVLVKYPKTWSAFVTEKSSGGLPIDGFFHPSFVPGTQSGTAFAVRLQVVATAYDQELKQFDTAIKSGKAKVTPFKAELVPSITGTRIDGEYTTGKKGTVVLVPLRDKTLKISTEAEQFSKDFDTIILPNLNFVP